MKHVLILLLATLAFVSCVKEDNSESINEFDPSVLFDRKLTIAHRGLNGYPENSYTAIYAAIEAGYKAVECDIARTSDGIYVLSHDWTIDRCSNGSGNISKMTYDELLQYDFGSWVGQEFSGEKIARLEDVLLLCKKKGVLLELDVAYKWPTGSLLPLYDLVKKTGTQSLAIFCGTKTELEALLAEPLEINISVSGIVNMEKAEEALFLKDKVTHINYSVPFANLSSELIDYIQSNDVGVKTWTVNTEEDLQNAFEMGVNYAITDVLLQ